MYPLDTLRARLMLTAVGTSPRASRGRGARHCRAVDGEQPCLTALAFLSVCCPGQIPAGSRSLTTPGRWFVRRVSGLCFVGCTSSWRGTCCCCRYSCPLRACTLRTKALDRSCPRCRVRRHNNGASLQSEIDTRNGIGSPTHYLSCRPACSHKAAVVLKRKHRNKFSRQSGGGGETVAREGVGQSGTIRQTALHQFAASMVRCAR